jgi:hypothetical protein
MPSSLRGITSLRIFYLLVILTAIPLPVSSVPLILLTRIADENAPSGSIRMDNKMTFDSFFALRRCLLLAHGDLAHYLLSILPRAACPLFPAARRAGRLSTRQRDKS